SVLGAWCLVLRASCFGALVLGVTCRVPRGRAHLALITKERSTKHSARRTKHARSDIPRRRTSRGGGRGAPRRACRHDWPAGVPEASSRVAPPSRADRRRPRKPK